MATKAKTVKAAPVLKSSGQADEAPRVEHVTIKGKLATYVMDINLAGSTFNAYIVDNDGHEYDIDADINAY